MLAINVSHSRLLDVEDIISFYNESTSGITLDKETYASLDTSVVTDSNEAKRSTASCNGSILSMQRSYQANIT